MRLGSQIIWGMTGWSQSHRKHPWVSRNFESARLYHLREPLTSQHGMIDWLSSESDQLRTPSPVKIRQGKWWQEGRGWEIVFPGWSERISRMARECYFLQERRGIISEPSGGSQNKKRERGYERSSRSHVLLFADAHDQAISWQKWVN